MTRREFATLVYLAKHPSWVFSAGQIYEEVWGEDGENCGTAVAFVPKINANADGYEYLYRIETAGR